MTIFFLHLQDAGERIEDSAGTDFPSLAAARAEAERSAREIMAENLREGRELDHAVIEIANAEGTVLETVRFRDVLRGVGWPDRGDA